MSLNTNFVHLRLHSEYSIVDGAVRIDDAIAAVVKDQMGALALTDLSNVFGLVKFYQAARKEGIKPIIGSDVWITNNEDRDKPFRLQLLVKNHQGYLNLCELLTKASLTNQFKGRSELDETWFKGHADLSFFPSAVIDLQFVYECIDNHKPFSHFLVDSRLIRKNECVWIGIQFLHPNVNHNSRVVE